MATVLGHVDGFVGGYLNGWATIDGSEQICVVDVFEGTNVKVASGYASRRRDDLASLDFGRSDLGFRIPVPFGKSSFLRVMVDGRELANSPVPVGDDVFDGYFSVAAGVATGWISRRSSLDLAIAVALHLPDGTQVGHAVAEPVASDNDPYFRPCRFSIPLDLACVGRDEFLVTLVAQNKPIANALAGLPVDGYLDHIGPDGCGGWLVCANAPSLKLEMVAYRDGQRVGAAICNLPRPDVRELYPKQSRCGFFIRFDTTAPDAGDLFELSLRLEGSEIEMFSGPFIVGPKRSFIASAKQISNLVHKSRTGLPDFARGLLQNILLSFAKSTRGGSDYVSVPGLVAGRADAAPFINIIIPIYRGVDITRECIESVLQHRGERDWVVLIADAPPEPQMHIMLERYRAAQRVVLLKNATNLGFIGTVNRGLRFCRDGDVLLLNSDTRLYPGGLAEMHQTLRDAPDIASVTPLSNNATIFSYPHPALAGAALEDVDFAELAQVALKENGGISIDVPTGHGFCLLIRREVLDRLGLLDVVFGRGYGEENEFCARATDLGFRHVAAVGAFVSHHESVSFGSEKLALIETNIERLSRMYPEYIPTIMAYERHDHLRAGRWGLDMFRLRTLRDAGERFALIVDNSLGGGTKKSSADLDAFVGYGDRLVLRLSSGKEGRIHLECDQIKLCAVFLRGEHEELLRVLDAAECDLVIYHQLLGYDAAMIEALGIWSRQRMAVCYLHDFYPICPRATLINAVGDFCGVASADICDRCVHLAGAHENANLDGILVAEHRSIFSSFLADMTTIIAPSRNAAGYVQQVFPSLSLETIRHPNKAGAYPSSMRDGKLVNVVILGAIGPHKGSRKLLEIASHALLTHPHLNFTVVGYTDIDDELKKLPNMKISGRYKPEELPVILGQLDSSVALFLQVWPETFSYTLSEAVQAGLLPIVPDIGAPAERVRDAGFGIVVPFPIDIKQLLATIDTLDLKALRQCDPRGFDASSSIEVLRKLLS